MPTEHDCQLCRQAAHHGRRGCEWYEHGQQGGLADEQGDLWAPEHHGRVPLAESGLVGICWCGCESAQPFGELLGCADDQHTSTMFDRHAPRGSWPVVAVVGVLDSGSPGPEQSR